MTPKREKKQSLPSFVLGVIEREPGFWSNHSADNADRLDLDWTDVLSIVSSPEFIKKERDSFAMDGYKYAMIGPDTRGRRLYTAGKVVEYASENFWRVITIHEAD